MTVLSRVACVLLFLLCGCTTDRYQCESETISKLSELESLIRKVEVGHLATVKEYGDLLHLFRAKGWPEDDAPDKFFRKDGWLEPFSFERLEEGTVVVFVISKQHKDHHNRPLSLSATLTDDNKLTTTKSWKNN